jgi:hypothetical protein
VMSVILQTTRGVGLMKKPSNYPMHNSLRCRARSKRSGLPCKAPAVRGWKVCRMHGARGGAPTGVLNGNYKHGERTKEAIAVKQDCNALIAESMGLANSIL